MQRKKALIVDDDDLMRSMLQQMMAMADIDSVEAENGRAALAAFENERFDIVITDILMPDTEGLETITRMTQLRPDVPIIAISGGAKINPESYLDMAREFGACHVFKKPFDRGSFMAAVTGCLEKNRGGPVQ
jgi:DNA-binding NtrC family response regulator